MTGNLTSRAELESLWQRHRALGEAMETTKSQREVDRLGAQQDKIEHQIVTAEPETIGGVVVQMKLLTLHHLYDPLAVAIVRRLEALAQAPAGAAGPLSSTY